MPALVPAMAAGRRIPDLRARTWAGTIRSRASRRLIPGDEEADLAALPAISSQGLRQGGAMAKRQRAPRPTTDGVARLTEDLRQGKLRVEDLLRMAAPTEGERQAVMQELPTLRALAAQGAKFDPRQRKGKRTLWQAVAEVLSASTEHLTWSQIMRAVVPMLPNGRLSTERPWRLTYGEDGEIHGPAFKVLVSQVRKTISLGPRNS